MEASLREKLQRRRGTKAQMIDPLLVFIICSSYIALMFTILFSSIDLSTQQARHSKLSCFCLRISQAYKLTGKPF